MTNQLTSKVRDFIKRNELLAPGDTVVVGCSGGADSTCLLHLLGQGLPELGLSCFAVYVDHGLRERTEEERALVREAAERVGARFALQTVDVPGERESAGGSVQEVARRLRYRALESYAAQVGASRIAVGHTLDDQAETLLLQLLRGAGTTGMAAISPSRGLIVRPILVLSREETETYCREHGLRWFEDPSNQTDVYLRNRVRRSVIPALSELSPNIKELLARTAEVVRADEEYLEQAAGDALDRIRKATYRDEAAKDAGKGEREETVILSATGLSSLPAALSRRIVRMAARRVKGGATEISLEQVDSVLALTRSLEGSAEVHLPGGLVVRREYDDLSFFRRRPNSEETLAARNSPEEIPLQVPGTTHIPWAEMEIHTSEHSVDETMRAPANSSGVVHIDGDAVVGALTVRPRRAGDRMRPAGLGGSKKLQDIFVDMKVPLRQRSRVPILCDELGILWVAGICIDERVKVTEKTRRILGFRTVAAPGGTED